MNLINLTGHHVAIQNRDGDVVAEVPPSGAVARANPEYVHEGVRGGIPVEICRTVEITGLPDPEPGKAFIVSSKVERYLDRDDVYCPGRIIYDEDNNVEACVGLRQTE